MVDHITIRRAAGTWVVRAGGAVVGESANALELNEGSYQPVIYFPRDDLAMAFLEKTDSTTRCPHKGQASYFTVSGPDGEVVDAGWSYEEPIEGMEQIKGHIAFYADRVAVEKL